MAIIPYPDGLKIVDASYPTPWHPSQREIPNAFGFSSQFFSYTYPTWRGSVEFGAADSDDLGALLEATIGPLVVRSNILLLPMHRATIELSAATTVDTRDTTSDGRIRHTLAAALPAATKIGHWVASGNRRYIIRWINAARTQVILDPQVPLANGDDIANADSIRTRLAPEAQFDFPRSIDWWGPVSYRWVEAFES